LVIFLAYNKEAPPRDHQMRSGVKVPFPQSVRLYAKRYCNV